jgi:hypothetical protein
MSWMTPARQTFKSDTPGDCRKIPDRTDIDAVLIATPDFSHTASCAWSVGIP